MDRHMRHRRDGFTLLEVMLVLGILAMLALFVVPRFIGVQKTAEIRQAQAMVGRSGPIATALGLYNQSLGTMPEKLIDLVERPDDLDDDDTRWYKFLEEANFTDPWGEELEYEYPGDVNEDGYDLISKGPDKDLGTEDDITNFPQDS